MWIVFLVCSVVRHISPLVIKSIGSSGVVSSLVSLAFLLLGVVMLVVGCCQVVFVITLGKDVGFVIIISMSHLPWLIQSLLNRIILLIRTLSLKRRLLLLPSLRSNNIGRLSFLPSMCLLIMSLVRFKCVIKELVISMVSWLLSRLRSVFGIVKLVSTSYWFMHRFVHKLIVCWLELLGSPLDAMGWVFLFVL